jgi:pimeloyl-ACP methyl ester carboxylesterase
VPVAASFYEPVATDARVLVFAGGRDPVTPPAYARRATQQMPHAQIVEVPALGHDADGLVGVSCLDQIELAFRRDPAAPLDTSCIAAIAAPKFSLRLP